MHPTPSPTIVDIHFDDQFIDFFVATELRVNAEDQFRHNMPCNTTTNVERCSRRITAIIIISVLIRSLATDI